MYTCDNCGSSALKVHKRRIKKNGGKSIEYRCSVCGKYKTFSEESEILNEQVSYKDIYNSTDVTVNHKRIVVTSCQSNTKTNYEFLSALQMYCVENDAKLYVIPIKYRNPKVSDNEELNFYDEVLEEYLLDDNIKIHPKLRILGKLKINATAANPLIGLDSVTRGDSIIIGHNQLQYKSIPVSQSDYPVIMTTTGTISEENYSESKSGYKAEFNHTFSATVVELDSDKFHIRQLHFDGAGFYDLDKYYTPMNVEKVNRISALIPGDEHAMFVDARVKEATFGENGISELLNPEYIVRHDLLDCYSVSHHHKNNVFTKYAKHKSGKDNLRKEILETIEYLIDTHSGAKNLIVSSNHNDHLTKWLNYADPKLEPWNALLYHQLMFLILSKTNFTKQGTSMPNPFEVFLDDYISSTNIYLEYTFLDRTTSYKIEDIEISYHGDAGSNGSRGNRVGFSKLSSKTVIGHSHTPGIEKGCYQTGTSSELQLEYNIGPSSWMHTHCIIYPNGKRTLINIINGEWRL